MGCEPRYAATSPSPSESGCSLARCTGAPASAGDRFGPLSGPDGTVAGCYCALIEWMVTVFRSSLRTPVTTTSVPANSVTFS